MGRAQNQLKKEPTLVAAALKAQLVHLKMANWAGTCDNSMNSREDAELGADGEACGGGGYDDATCCELSCPVFRYYRTHWRPARCSRWATDGPLKCGFQMTSGRAMDRDRVRLAQVDKTVTRVATDTRTHGIGWSCV
jgi:hypothetical protein